MDGINTKNMMLVLAVMVFISLPMLSSAQTCTMRVQKLNEECNVVETEEQLKLCCDEINLAVDNDLLCFCLLLFTVHGHEADFESKVVDSYFTPCGITGTFDTVCPGVAPAPPADP